MPDDGRELLYFNGVNGDSGGYDLPPATAEELVRWIQGESAPDNLNELRSRYDQAREQHFGVVEGVDPKDLAQAGWGAIFTTDVAPEVEEALQPLLRLRKAQAGDRFRVFKGPDAFRPNESKNAFLARHGVGPGPADPDRMPYYLLLVGGPDAIPYRFQTQLDVQYAVGRIQFEAVEDYAAYADSVVAAEGGAVRLERRATFFGPANPDDGATELSITALILPLLDKLADMAPGWNVTSILRDEATKSRLADMLTGASAPPLLFTASHGMRFDLGSPRQVPHQGALLCQDWPGPIEGQQHGTVPPDWYFSADDLTADANLLGTVAFFFACYGGGTPQLGEFTKMDALLGGGGGKTRETIAEQPFLARLPMRMLSLPHGGALAVVGHIERAWAYSFNWGSSGSQTAVFESALRRLMSGYPVGAAMEYFDERYAEVAVVLSDMLEEIEYGRRYDPFELARCWTANGDARGYAIMGDPAVRLPLTDDALGPAERPVI